MSKGFAYESNRKYYNTIKYELIYSRKGQLLYLVFLCMRIKIIKRLKESDELRLLFTCQTFVKETYKKGERKFYIPNMSRESGLYETEFEKSSVMR